MHPTTPAAWVAALVQALERAAATYVQSFLVALTASTFFDQVDWSLAASLGVAAIPTAITVLAAAVGDLSVSATWPPIAQGAFRVVRTWAATFLGFLGAAAWTLDLSELRLLVGSAVAAAGAAFLAALKAEVAVHVGDRESTALLPARYDFALAA